MSNIRMRLERISYSARHINLYSFKPVDGGSLPPVEAGAHVDLFLRSDLVRQYSLLRPGKTPEAFVVGIKKESAGRGGSRYIHEQLRVGDVIDVGQPRNNFPLVEDAADSVLFAGGIGITPIWAMAQRLDALGRPWRMYVSARSREDCALLDEIGGYPNVVLHFDDENPGRFMDLAAAVAEAPEGAHFYCCGPAPMLTAYREATSHLPAAQVHDEAFSIAPPTTGEGSDFRVRLAQSGQEIEVPADRSILDTLRDQGFMPMSSCEAGVCGMCETRVLEGEVDHRDHVLSPDEQTSNSRMMICCSRARSALLVLDL